MSWSLKRWRMESGGIYQKLFSSLLTRPFGASAIKCQYLGSQQFLEFQNYSLFLVKFVNGNESFPSCSFYNRREASSCFIRPSIDYVSSRIRMFEIPLLFEIGLFTRLSNRLSPRHILNM